MRINNRNNENNIDNNIDNNNNYDNNYDNDNRKIQKKSSKINKKIFKAIKREPDNSKLKNWPIKLNNKIVKVYDIFDFLKNNKIDGIIKLDENEFNFIDRFILKNSKNSKSNKNNNLNNLNNNDNNYINNSDNNSLNNSLNNSDLINDLNSIIVHFNFEISNHIKGRIYSLNKIIKHGFYKSDSSFELPILDFDNFYLAECLSVFEGVKIDLIPEKYYKLSQFEDGDELIEFILKNYKNQIADLNVDLIKERGVSISILKIIKFNKFKEHSLKYSYFDFLDPNSFGSTRVGFGKGIIEAKNLNKNVVALTADLKSSVKLDKFAELFPNDFYEFSISEQNMMSAGAGMCLNNKIPFITSFAVFNPGRNWDQLRVSVCYSNHNVKILGSHAGLTTGPDGATHQALEDIAITRVLPNLIVIVPCDENQTILATIEASKIKSPVYLRVSREKSLNITSLNDSFQIGKAQIFDEGDDVTIIATGLTLQFALEARKILLERENILASVINLHTIKPLDEKTILKFARKTGAIVTIEEHQRIGGMGSAISELIVQNYLVPIEIIGVDDKFGESGEGYELLKKYGISIDEIIRRVKRVIKRKNN